LISDYLQVTKLKEEGHKKSYHSIKVYPFNPHISMAFVGKLYNQCSYLKKKCLVTKVTISHWLFWLFDEKTINCICN